MRALGVATITHAHAPLDLLESVSYVGADPATATSRMRREAGVEEVAILSTCNRTEIYALFAGPADPRRLAWLLAEDRGVCWGSLRDHVRLLTGEDAAAHLFRVTAGADSLAFGEAEIVAQVKAVHAGLRRDSQEGLAGLFEAALRAGRTVRRDVSFGDAGASLGTVAVAAAAELAPSPAHRVLLVGAGKIARSVLAALPHDAEVVVASRTQETAARLVGGRGKAAGMADFAAELASADVVYFCASSRRPILDATGADAVTAQRATPLVAVDLGLPRNVAAEVRLVPGIELVDLEGLRSHAGTADRIRALTDVEPVVAREVARYRDAVRARAVAPLIAAIRSSLGSLARAELDRSFDTTDPARLRAEQMLHRITGRVAHAAIVEARRAAAAGDAAALETLGRAFRVAPGPHTQMPVTDGSTREEVA
ncbi:MAG TPA: glutamyl-tRNA reductase [Actinomycetota bacterium]|nr:glutamyl-tRNA reductase [Actinomycetota bacterium]